MSKAGRFLAAVSFKGRCRVGRWKGSPAGSSCPPGGQQNLSTNFNFPVDSAHADFGSMYVLDRVNGLSNGLFSDHILDK